VRRDLTHNATIPAVWELRSVVVLSIAARRTTHGCRRMEWQVWPRPRSGIDWCNILSGHGRWMDSVVWAALVTEMSTTRRVLERCTPDRRVHRCARPRHTLLTPHSGGWLRSLGRQGLRVRVRRWRKPDRVLLSVLTRESSELDPQSRATDMYHGSRPASSKFSTRLPAL